MVFRGHRCNELARYFLIKTDGAKYELFKACNRLSEVVLFSQVFDIEYPPGSGFDLIITKAEPSIVTISFNNELRKVRQRELMQNTRDG
jgi:hypothetical protein